MSLIIAANIHKRNNYIQTFFFFFFENVYPTLIDEYGSFSKKKNKIMSVDEF